MAHIPCPLCERNRGRRSCPAIGREICAVCCGTKRLVEIACPPDCVYLASARTHPPAAVVRQQDRDLRFLASAVNGLGEREYQVFVLLQRLIGRAAAQAVPRLLDREVTEAAAALAATIETERRGIIYEHRPASLPGQRLFSELKEALNELETKTRGQVSGPAAAALRRIEGAARTAGKAFEPSETAYLDLVSRVMRADGDGVERGGGQVRPEREVSSKLILP